MFVGKISRPSSITSQIQWIIIKRCDIDCWHTLLMKFNNQPYNLKHFGVMALELPKIVKIKQMSFNNHTHIYWIIIKLYDNVCGYNILPKFVNQLIASSIPIIQIDSRHLLSYYMQISTVVFCDIWTLLLHSHGRPSVCATPPALMKGV